MRRSVVFFTIITYIALFTMQCGEADPKPQYTGDLQELQDRGVIRVIVRPDAISHLPRNAEPVTLDRDLAKKLAEELNVVLELVTAEDHSTMISKLLQGHGDLIAANLTDTPDRKAQTAYSIPYYFVDEYLIVPEGAEMPSSIDDLNGMRVSVRASSSYYQTLFDLQQEVPGLQIETVPETMSTEQIIHEMAGGAYQSTVCDNNLWKAVENLYPGLAPALTLAENREIVLLMRPEDTMLKNTVDEFLHAQRFSRTRDQVFTDDLAGLKERGRLRMITRNNALTYFIHRGVQIGFEFELMREFAARQGLRLEIVIPDSHAELFSYLNDGKGDVIAAAMSINEERSAQVAFSIPYNDVEELVVVRSDEEDISSFQDLIGRKIHVRNSSSYRATLEAIADSIPDLEIVKVPDDVETEDILEGIDEGIYDVTIADSNLLEVERAYGRNLKSVFSVKPSQLGWAVRKDNVDLLAALDEYVKKEKKGLYFNMMRKRYFENKRTMTKAKDSLRVDLGRQLSPFDELARKYASRYGLDWRLVTAQMFQESKFDPNAVSWVGAVGLMQVMPATGRELGFTQLHEPEVGIHAGTKYMDQLLKRFDPKLPMQARVRFALASYNVGYGHVLDARRLAREMGKDPDRWFGHVEEAMLLLSKPAYYTRSRYGYCRGGQPVHYVENIQNSYDAYVEVLATDQSTRPYPAEELGDPAQLTSR